MTTRAWNSIALRLRAMRLSRWPGSSGRTSLSEAKGPVTVRVLDSAGDLIHAVSFPDPDKAKH